MRHPCLFPRPLSSTASTGYEQQLASIAGNRYYTEASYVTANVNLWPRPLVIVMGTDAFERLTSQQQDALRDAAAEGSLLRSTTRAPRTTRRCPSCAAEA